MVDFLVGFLAVVLGMALFWFIMAFFVGKKISLVLVIATFMVAVAPVIAKYFFGNADIVQTLKYWRSQYEFWFAIIFGVVALAGLLSSYSRARIIDDD